MSENIIKQKWSLWVFAGVITATTALIPTISDTPAGLSLTLTGIISLLLFSKKLRNNNFITIKSNMIIGWIVSLILLISYTLIFKRLLDNDNIENIQNIVSQSFYISIATLLLVIAVVFCPVFKKNSNNEVKGKFIKFVSIAFKTLILLIPISSIGLIPLYASSSLMKDMSNDVKYIATNYVESDKETSKSLTREGSMLIYSVSDELYFKWDCDNIDYLYKNDLRVTNPMLTKSDKYVLKQICDS